ncbi:hypothetical protein [Microbispora sp. NBRC 16548]|uniref:hypothetical protein n=1 Tax=Microbispora sp. NBRC 16548 TaxID=3030994 RepID=UPI0025560A23|nr:hypothetical protein [Microbispora sp. NBRC 16548]
MTRLQSRLRGLPPPVVDAALVLAVLAGQSAPFLFTQPGLVQPAQPIWFGSLVAMYTVAEKSPPVRRVRHLDVLLGRLARETISD